MVVLLSNKLTLILMQEHIKSLLIIDGAYFEIGLKDILKSNQQQTLTQEDY